MKLNLNKALTDLDAKDIPNTNMGKMLANALVQANKGDILKHWEWALKLNAGNEIDLDSSDKSKLKEFIEVNEGFTILTKAQLLLEFEVKLKKAK
jgi:hypothetical protein